MQLDIKIDSSKGWVNVAHGVSEAKAKALTGNHREPGAEFRLYDDQGILLRTARVVRKKRLRWEKANGRPRDDQHPGTYEDCLPCSCGHWPVRQPFKTEVGYKIVCGSEGCPAMVQASGSVEVIQEWNRMAKGIV